MRGLGWTMPCVAGIRGEEAAAEGPEMRGCQVRTGIRHIVVQHPLGRAHGVFEEPGLTC